jgi:hypothetical protein
VSQYAEARNVDPQNFASVGGGVTGADSLGGSAMGGDASDNSVIGSITINA